MSAQIIPFNYNSKSVRVVEINGNPWFVAVDVCAILGVRNASDAIRRLDDDEVTLDQIEGSHRKTNLISESGLYNLILRSDKLEAKPFRKWVTSEVLPSIRKTGGYQSTPAIPTTMIEALELALEQQKQIVLMGPKAEYFDQFLDASGLTGLQNGMRCVNAKPNKGIEALKDKGVLFHQGNSLVPKAYYIDQGYFKVKSTVRDGKTYKQTFFTNRGVEWVSNVLPDEVFLKGAA